MTATKTTSRRRFVRAAAASLTTLALLGAPALAHAAEVEVSATLGRARVEVGQSVYLQVEVSTDGGSISAPRFVGVTDLEVSARGSSSGMSVEISGSRSVRRSTKTFTYVLTPQAAGEHEIEIEVEVDGRPHRPASAPKLVATGENFVPEVEHDKAGDTPPAPDSEVIVWPVVDKARAYVGEQVIYELQIWERARGNLTIAAAPTFKDFWSEDLETARQQQRRGAERKLLDGVPYRVHQTMRRALFPQKAGTLTIGGPEVQLQELSGPFFGGSGPPKSYLGRSLAVEVVPLPAAGRPKGFRANSVGAFRITSEVDRAEVRQGEAVRLSVRISGTGNIALIELPELPKFDGLRSYEPKPETPKLELGTGKLQGSRVFTMLVVADRAGTLEIPAIELPYFDPDADEYKVAKTKAITLEVEANPDAPTTPDPAGTAEDAPDQAEDELLAPPIASDSLERTTPRERWLTPPRWWAGTLGGPLLLGLGFLGARLRERYGPDDRARARSQELARRRALLNEANAALDSGEGFYPTLAALLQAAAVMRAGPQGVGLTRERLMKLLAERDVANEEITQLRELLDACDAARFGSGSGELAQRREHLERARALLGRRSWRPQ
ncbi:hypothetical protein ENSA5_15490 [Enhygromyxa salina]|uniref:Protein BatD n=1 Tax=Enhygromyxa salina TaxID=215803 RepID=A0A2S9YEI5_9BACT|nr:BatD family protein [Enhygromyxa salina]PRQ03519.1 hypothetical protein ENSA5_15490 [Enhygromyxa salina]